MPNCHVQKETSFQNQRKICRQCLICKVYLNLKGLAPNRTYINFIDNLCAIYFSRAIYNFSPKFAHKLPRKLSPNTKSRRLLPVSCWIWSFFWVKSSRVGSWAVWNLVGCILWFQVTVSREKSKVHVTAEVQIFGVHWKLGDGFVTQGTSCKWQLAKTTIWKTRFLRNLLRSYDSPIFSGLKTDGFFMVLVSKV